MWDGKTPEYLHLVGVQADPDTPYTAAWRITTRLNDLGFGKSTPVKGEQSWPTKNYGLWCEANGVDPVVTYSPEVHSAIFGVPLVCQCCGQELPSE